MDKCKDELGKYLTAAYDDNVKGVMGYEIFVLLRNQFKRECDELKETQQKIQTECETAQKFQDGLTYFRREFESQIDIIFLIQDIIGQFID